MFHASTLFIALFHELISLVHQCHPSAACKAISVAGMQHDLARPEAWFTIVLITALNRGDNGVQACCNFRASQSTLALSPGAGRTRGQRLVLSRRSQSGHGRALSRTLAPADALLDASRRAKPRHFRATQLFRLLASLQVTQPSSRCCLKYRTSRKSDLRYITTTCLLWNFAHLLNLNVLKFHSTAKDQPIGRITARIKSLYCFCLQGILWCVKSLIKSNWNQVIMLAMDSLWCGSESELSTLRLCKSTVEKSDYRLRRKPSKGSKSLIPQGLLHAAESQPRAVRRRRSGTWP